LFPKSEEIDRLNAELAIRGGFGSSNGLAQIRESERAWDQAMNDMKAEFSFERGDFLSAAAGDGGDICHEPVQGRPAPTGGPLESLNAARHRGGTSR